MGERVGFYKCTKGSYISTIRNCYLNFKGWYIAYAQSTLTEFNEEFGTKELKEYLVLHNNIQAMPAELLDEYCVEFIYAYDDAMYAEQQNVFSLFGPTMNKWRYKKSTKLIASTKDEQLITLWSFIVNGRPLSGKAKFESISQEASIGYITDAERKVLQSKLQHYFSVGNPTEEGIGYVLQMLEEVANENCDVVITVDGTDSN